MNFVSGNKIGKVLNVMINGNTYTKKFDTDKDALDAFKKVISTSENPTDDAIKALKHMSLSAAKLSHMDIILRIAYGVGATKTISSA